MVAIDLFSGAGGFTEGATQAGVHVIWAANHWQIAVDVHFSNHPLTTHSCQDLQQANFYDVPKCDLILASPACQGHSKARGKADTSKHDKDRTTAWAVVSALEAKKPTFAIVENVVEFKKWVLYPVWKVAIERLGYSISENIINAADCGVCQNRIRLFFVITKSKFPINIPLPESKHIPAKSIINWNVTGKHYSEFFRTDKWTKRFFKAKSRYGDKAILSYYGSEDSGRSVDKPFGTLTTTQKFAIINNDTVRFLTIDETKKAMGFSTEYKLTGIKSIDHILLGNAVCPPVAEYIIKNIIKK